MHQFLCSDFRHSWIPPQATWTSLPAAVYFRSRTEFTALGVLRTQYLKFLVLIFVPAWLHAKSNACWRPCWEDPRMQYHFVRKMQLIHLQFPTVTPSSMTGYPIHIDQGSPKFWERTTCKLLQNSSKAGHLAKCYFFRICSMLPNQQIFRKYIIFSLLAKRIAAEWNGFTGRIWPTSSCVKSPDIDWRGAVTAHTIAWVQHIYLRRHGHNFLSRNTITWRSTRGIRQHRYSHNTHIIFHEEPGNIYGNLHTFPRSTKHVYTSFACYQDFSKIYWSGNSFWSATVATKTALGIIQLWFIYFGGIMACTLPGRQSKDMPRLLVHSLLSPFLCMEMINLPIFRCHSKTPCHLTHTSQPNHPAFQVPQFAIKLFAISLKLGFSSGIRELIDAQFYGSLHLCKVKISHLKNFAQFCQVRCQCWQKESRMLSFLFP